MPGVAPVRNSEPVPPTLNFKERPRLPVDHDGVSLVLGIPLRVNGWVIPRLVHEDRPVSVKTPVNDDQVAVVLFAGGQFKGIFDLRVSDDVWAQKPGKNVYPGKPQGMIVVQKISGVLRVRVSVNLGGPRLSLLFVSRGEPSERAAVALRTIHAAVEMHYCGNSLLWEGSWN